MDIGMVRLALLILLGHFQFKGFLSAHLLMNHQIEGMS